MKKSHYPTYDNCLKLSFTDFPNTLASMESADGTRHKKGDIVIGEECHWGYMPCPNIMELFDELPAYIEDDWHKHVLKVEKNFSCYHWYKFFEWTPPNALTELWLWFNEKK